MSTTLAFYTLDFLLWSFMAVSVLYVAVFAFISLFAKRSPDIPLQPPAHRFLVLFPAYAEDNVVRQSVSQFLLQDYPRDHYHVAVISDHMQPSTNAWLQQQPITLLQPQFVKSSKALALQYAIGRVSQVEPPADDAAGTTTRAACPPYSKVVILDADNIVSPDFLKRLNALCLEGHQAIQCHRTAKNADSDVAVLDGVSEEINNTVFRLAHNRAGLSSALIGSGMCFDYDWFLANVGSLTTAGEDRELEALLIRQHVHIHYADSIHVKDEKVSTADNFQRQRLRWMTAQLQCLAAMLPHLPHAVATLHADYIDKTLQQALIPRSLLLVATLFMAAATTLLCLLSPFSFSILSLKYWLLLLLLGISLLVAIPPLLRSQALMSSALSIPRLAFRMLRNMFHINPRSTEFIHTTHDK